MELFVNVIVPLFATKSYAHQYSIIFDATITRVLRTARTEHVEYITSRLIRGLVPDEADTKRLSLLLSLFQGGLLPLTYYVNLFKALFDHYKATRSRAMRRSFLIALYAIKLRDLFARTGRIIPTDSLRVQVLRVILYRLFTWILEAGQSGKSSLGRVCQAWIKAPGLNDFIGKDHEIEALAVKVRQQIELSHGSLLSMVIETKDRDN